MCNQGPIKNLGGAVGGDEQVFTWREYGACLCPGCGFGDVRRYTGRALAIEGVDSQCRGREVAYLPLHHVHYETV